MGDGGRPLAQLRALSEKFPISVHGVGLSIGGETPLDRAHLGRLKTLCDWLNPASFSEHLAWSTHDAGYMNDLLPLPYTQSTLDRVAGHIDQLQNYLGRQMLLENPSTYLSFASNDMAEVDFLHALTHRTGCGLLLDVNNVFVSATNQGYGPRDYIDAFPLDRVGEIHLGGHDTDTDDTGRALLIDSHAKQIADPVWDLYDYTIKAGGKKPTLIEWDTDIPPLDTMMDEATQARAILMQAGAHIT
jgi:uncharacterized protein (UPF0276 family)